MKVKMRRKIMTALISIVMLALGTVAVAPPAHAVTGGSFCFHYENGYAYTDQPVYIQVSTDITYGWHDILVMTPDANGCGSFIVYGVEESNMYLRAYAYWEITGNLGEGALQRHSASSPLIGNPGVGAPYLGNGMVLCQGISIPCS